MDNRLLRLMMTPGGSLFLLVVINHSVIAVLNMPSRMGDKILFAKKVLQMMTGNAWFPNPLPTLADFAAHIAALEAAQINVKARVPGAVDIRNTAIKVVIDDLKLLCKYVQTVSIINPDDATEIVHSAGMAVKTIGSINKQDFSVTSRVAGSGELVSKVKVRRCAHEWGMTTDPNDPAKWYAVPIPPTVGGKTVVTGLASGTRMWFRHRTIRPDGPDEWDQLVTIIIS